MTMLPGPEKCRTDGCANTGLRAGGFCSGCYKRLRRTGSTDPQPRPTEAEMLWRHIRRAPGGCWLWIGSVNENGYGTVGRWRGPQRRAHRAFYELLVGPIPDGLDLDHLCRVRRCVNPAHLEPVTRSENLRRSVRSMRLVCKKGHPLTPENTRVKSDGRRRCRTCQREADRRREARRARG